jgi:Flp pilus assembly protein TadB
MSFPFLVAALVTAHACILALEAELKASREAWESANTAKVSDERATKLAESRAKKAEKALTDADQKRPKREQSITKRFDKIFVIVGSQCRTTPLEYLFMLSFANICLLILFMSQRRLGNLGSFVSQILKILYWLHWTCWNPIESLFRMSSS